MSTALTMPATATTRPRATAAALTPEQEITMKTASTTTTPIEIHTPAIPAAIAAPGASTTTHVVNLALPPSNALIPSPPPGFVAPSMAPYRGILPRLAEVAMMPLAVEDLVKFTDYVQTLGATAPAYAHVLETFRVAHAWTSMRACSTVWDAYCLMQEALAWEAMRTQMGSLRPAFELALTANAMLGTRLPNLASLLGARRAIAKMAAATNKLNKKAIAEGRPPVHGAAGKRKLRKAEKAALAAQVAAAGGGGH